MKNAEEDHPRGCGENQTAQTESSLWIGSPPRMRGKPLALPQARLFLGITPADAGKTDELNDSVVEDEDHPRGCGENLHRLPPFTFRRGSPPRMRGKRFA